MNKKLLALAIGAAIAMPVAALAEGPTLYGKINVTLESVEDEIGIDPDLGTTVPLSASDEGWVVRDNQSRIGVKGSADTSVSGLKGIYKAEFGIEADDGAESVGNPFSQRDIYAGLEGDFGTLKLGRLWETPLQSAQGAVDRFDDTSVDMGNHVAGESSASNVISYSTPGLLDDALKIHVALIPGENSDVDNDLAGATEDGLADSTSLAVVYDKNGLYLAAAMDSTVENESLGGAVLSSGDPLDIVRLVVGYSTDTFSVGYLFQTAEDVSFGSSNEDESMVLSGAYKMDAVTIKAQFATTEGDNGLAGPDPEISMMGIGADYALGKSTTASAFYASEEVDAGTATFERTILSFGLDQKF